MALNKEDLSFKILINKESTTPSREFFQENGVSTLDINATEVYTSTVSTSSVQSVTDGVARSHTQFVLTPDPSFPTRVFYFISGSGFTPGTDALPSFAQSSSYYQRNFLGDKYGSDYEVQLFDNSGTRIFKTDAINWIFNYKTGILSISDPGAYSTPYKVSVYQYTGNFLNTSLTSGSSTATGDKISSGSTIVSTFNTPQNGYTIIASGSLNISGSINSNAGISGSFSGSGALLSNVTSSLVQASSGQPFISATSTGIRVSGSTSLDSNLTITGSTNIVGSFTASNNVLLGDNSSDNIYFSGSAKSNLIPADNNTFDLGSSSNRWKTVHAGSASLSGATIAGNLTVNGTATITNLVAVTASSIQTSQKYILINSGSDFQNQGTTPYNTGILIQSRTGSYNNSGSSLAFAYAESYKRFIYSTGSNATNPDAGNTLTGTFKAAFVTVETGNSLPNGPLGLTSGEADALPDNMAGAMYVDSANGDVYLWS